MDNTATKGGRDAGATVVITHRVGEENHAAYEEWLGEIGPVCRAWPGHLDWHIVRPISGLTETYTVIVRFDTRAHLQAWLESPVRADLIDRVRPLLATGDGVQIRSGLEFWFMPEGAPTPVPVRWKQYLVTWSAIYPLALGVPVVVSPVLDTLGVSDNRPLSTLAVTAAVVFLMVYVVMPRYTRVVRRWLFA